MFKLEAFGVRILEGVERNIEVHGNVLELSLNRQEPFEHTRIIKVSSRSESLSLSMPITGERVIAGVKDFIEHVVHAVHQIMTSAMV